MLQTKISTEELPEELEGFNGGMGYKSIQSITANDLGFEEDITGYISEEVDGYYYAEILDGDCHISEYAKSDRIDEIQQWLTNSIFDFATEKSTN